MAEEVLAINAGSSSLKFALFALDAADPRRLLGGQIAGIGATPRIAHDAAEDAERFATLAAGVAGVSDHDGALALLLDWLAKDAHHLVAAGHRVVHGGARRAAPALIDDALIDELAALAPLAPHHQPHNVAAIRALRRRAPRMPQVACFDTAFHAGQPPVARRLGLPRAYEARGLRRYGFHGLSYEYVAGALPAARGGPLPERLVVAHLGNGASMCAIRQGRSVATTMGFSTLDGLPMGTRSGAIDPGAILYLLEEEGMDAAALTKLLYDRCGLYGLSGVSGDMKALLASDDPRAAEAVEFFAYRIGRELGSLAAALGGLDALVFTGGIGEHAAPVRARVCQDAAWLGVVLDAAANEAGKARISTPDSAVEAWRLATDEERVIARHTRDLIATPT